MDRRNFLTGATALTAVTGFSFTRPGEGAAQASSLRKLRFGTAIKSVNPIVIQLVIGEKLGYNAEEGFAMELSSLGTNSNVAVALGNGDIDIGTSANSFIFPLYVKGHLPPIVSYFEHTYPYKWDVVVRPDSPLKTYADLKGKTIGVSDLGITDYPVTRAVLARMGIDPDKDVKWLAVGAGVPAGVALERKVIDALAYFDTGFGSIEAAGIALRFLPRPKDIPMIGGVFLAARADFLKAERKLAVGYARSVAKASEFILANPKAGAKVFLDMYPDLKKRNADISESIRGVLYSVDRRAPLWRPPYPNTKIGEISLDEFRRDAKFLDIKIDDFSTLYTNDLIAEINQFDIESVRKQARDYKI